MIVLGIVLLVLFVIVCLLIIGLVLLQNEEGDSLGGLFAGGSNSAFGSKSGNILTKTTYVMVAIFFVGTFALALLNKRPSGESLEKAAREQQAETSTEWWSDNQKTPDTESDSDGE